MRFNGKHNDVNV